MRPAPSCPSFFMLRCSWFSILPSIVPLHRMAVFDLTHAASERDAAPAKNRTNLADVEQFRMFNRSHLVRFESPSPDFANPPHGSANTFSTDRFRKCGHI